MEKHPSLVSIEGLVSVKILRFTFWSDLIFTELMNVTNTLAYCDGTTIMVVKIFIVQATVWRV
jgi:hypothetical protein